MNHAQRDPADLSQRMGPGPGAYPGGYPAMGYPDLQPAPGGLDVGLDDLFRALMRGWWILGGALLLGILGMLLLLRLITPRYTAESMVLINAEDITVSPVSEVVSEMPRDVDSARNEVFVLGSRSFADRVVRQLGLDQYPEFNPALAEDGDAEGITEAQQRTAIIDAFLERLEVAAKPESRVISIRFTSQVPERAAEVANTIAETYLLSRREAKFESTRTANAWLLERIETLRAEVETGEQAIEEMRAAYSLLSTGGVTLASQRLAELSAQLLRAGTERAEAEARLTQVRRATRESDSSTLNSQVLNSPLIQRLREQQAEVERRIAELSVEFGEKHPRMIQARAEARDIAAAIEDEIERVLVRLENDVAVARAQERALQEAMDAQKTAVAESNRNEIELRALEREVTSNRLLLDTLLARQKETLSQEDFDYQRADARIISEAFVPKEPSFPRPPLMLGLAVIASGMLGLLAILVRELLDSGFRSGQQLEEHTGVHSLGFLPYVSDFKDYAGPQDYIMRKPNAAYSEAVRTLNWSVNLLYPNDPAKIILITSSEPGEGKTTVASAFATSRAQAGQRAVLVDADTRRPTVHERYGRPREPGLTDVLTGEMDIFDVIHESEDGGTDIVAAGAPDPHSANLLDANAMVRMLEELCAAYDVVVVDSPPVMAGVDARVLAGFADTTVFVVRWGKTRRPVVKLALKQLEEAGGKLAGTLLSGVQIRKYARYAYGDSGAYSGDLGKYYVS